MKKNLLSLAIMLPIFGFSQLWTFDTDGDWLGWKSNNAPDATITSTVAGGSFNLYKGSGSYPFISNDRATGTSVIDGTLYKYLRVNLRNRSGLDKISFRSDVTSGINSSLVIIPTLQSAADSFKDYYIDLSTLADWGDAVDGTAEDKFTVRFSGAATLPVDQLIEISEIEFLQNLNKNQYDFTTYEEKWSSLEGTIAVNSGSLVLTPTTGKPAKIIQDVLPVDATNNKYVHVVYKNNSPSNNQLRFQFKDGPGYKGQNKSISTSTTGFEEVIFDLNAVAEWTGIVNDFQIIFKIAGGNTALDGTLEIDKIVINNSGSNLATTDVSNTRNLLQVYVTDNTLNFKNVNVSKATIFNANGQIVKDTKVTNNNIDISSLRTGVYIVKITAQDGSSSVKKIIKK